MNRRQFTLTPLLATAACARKEQAETGWPARWDSLLIQKTVEASSLRYDPDHSMIQAILGPEYRYHTRMRECRVHPTRDSLEYALYLLEEGSPQRVERAKKILQRVLALQVTNPELQWYGIWGWYEEEPPDRMAPADWNWADFNGSLLLLVEFRHGAKLGEPLRAQVREAILHAAQSIRRRNVSMAYTNIAVMGTFVTLAAAELLDDSDLLNYAQDRLQRLAAQIDETGSFAEYNSPTYSRVTIANLTRIRMYVRNEEARRRAANIERRAWLHTAVHWDAARKQFTGPMSRCYANDAGYPLWIEKALQGRLGLAKPDQHSGADGDVGILDYRCPADLAGRFLKPAAGTEHRELFIASPPATGTTYFANRYSLGSVNRGDFWVQRRPLLAYFGDASRPARVVQMRVVKDGYDFASALLFAVQKEGRVLGLINFRSPGGDKHPSLDPIKDGQFACGRLFVELDFEGLPESFQHNAGTGIVDVSSPLLRARYRICSAQFGAFKPVLNVTPGSQSLTATLDLKPVGGLRIVNWKSTGLAYAAFALELADDGEFAEETPQATLKPGAIGLKWGGLELTGLTKVATVEVHNAGFAATIDGMPAPAPRLSEEKLA